MEGCAVHKVVTDKNGRMRTEDVDPRAAPKPAPELLPLPLIYDEEDWYA